MDICRQYTVCYWIVDRCRQYTVCYWIVDRCRQYTVCYWIVDRCKNFINFFWKYRMKNQDGDSTKFFKFLMIMKFGFWEEKCKIWLIYLHIFTLYMQNIPSKNVHVIMGKCAMSYKYNASKCGNVSNFLKVCIAMLLVLLLLLLLPVIML